MRPTWAEVSLGALRRNYRAVQERVGDQVTICAVVKADAYGHGAVECARGLEQEGATWLGVTSTEEGVRLREAGIGARILLMTGFWRGEEADVLRHRLTPAVWEWWQVGGLEAALNKVVDAPRPFPIHIKLDTGMARLGVPEHYLKLFLNRVAAAKDVEIEGVFSHLASAEVMGSDEVERQAARFREFEQLIRERGLAPRYFHLSNSAAVATRPALFRDMVRPGIALYGYQLRISGSRDTESALAVEPVLSWKTRIISLREVGAGQGVGYNLTYVTQAPSKIAVLPVGYADGLNRHLSWRAEGKGGSVLVRGERVPIAGRVSMDITLADVTAVKGVNVGDEVTILGSDGAQRIDAWEHAQLAGTIPYEILCDIGKRVPRKFSSQ